MNRRIRNQSVVSFTLSFLDVLCCGLGAATLLLLILRHGPVPEPIVEEHSVVPVNVQSIKDEIAIKTEEKSELEKLAREQIVAINQVTSTVDANVSANQSQRLEFVNLVSELQKQKTELKKAQTRLAAAESTVEEEGDVETRDVGTHLTGLKVNNDRVLILLDSSASMMAPTLVEIIRLRASNVGLQQQAQKWQAARDAALWVYDKIASGGRFQILTYSESVVDLHGKTLKGSSRSQWIEKGDAEFTSAKVEQTVKNLRTGGATDLKSALANISSIDPFPTQVILITDGLPTLAGQTPLNRVSRSCPRPNPGSEAWLSPQCRDQIMKNATASTRSARRNVRLDVILYPLEGDANAVLPYWKLADSTGGRLLAPLPGWPSS